MLCICYIFLLMKAVRFRLNFVRVLLQSLVTKYLFEHCAPVATGAYYKTKINY